MDKDRIRQVLAYYEQFRSELLGDLEGYESGVHYTGEIRGDDRIDTTAKTIADLKGHRPGSQRRTERQR
jgi:uncharacterized protein YutE (UPF0331/DUF86 family)